jgi:magnesium-transporting ATPase (P-type)
MDQFSFCEKCKYETPEMLNKCPQCGRSIRTSKQVRRLGWVLVILGGFLIVFMVGLTVLMLGIMTNPTQSSTHFTGTPEDALFMFGVFGLVAAIGLSSLAGGVWQIWYGKRNKVVGYVVLGLALVFLVIGFMARLALTSRS